MRQSFYHLTRDGRETILEGIISGESLDDIASMIGMHPTSVSREVKLHRISIGKKTTRRANLCVHYKSCKTKKLCRNTCPKPRCASCQSRSCNDFCLDFIEDICPKTARWPHVCNGCGNRAYCGLEQFYYRPSVADATSNKTRSESRNQIALDKEELVALDELVGPLLKQNKQSPEVICSTNADTITISASTLRRYIDKGHCSAIRLDLYSAPSRKVRKKAVPRHSRHLDDGRSFADFTNLQTGERDNAWEIDTVIGSKKDSSCLLTFVNRSHLLFLAFKIWRCDTENVCGILDYLEILCSSVGSSFEDVFPLLLTDNGPEMSASEAMEQSLSSSDRRTRLFYCDPYSSFQKPHIEGRHTLLRRIVPKGYPIDAIGHHQIAKAVNHINSYPAMSRKGKTPFDMACEKIPAQVLEEFGLKKIPAHEVSLTTALLDK